MRVGRPRDLGRPLVLVLVVALCAATVSPGLAGATASPTRGSVATDTGAAATDGTTTDPITIAVEQGDACYRVQPLGDGTRTVEAFYDYNVSEDYSSLGTADLQENQVSNLLVYHGSEGYSLVMLHDAHGTDELGAKPYASTLTFDITGLPVDGEWAVEDDSYPGRDDNFDHDGTHSVIDWKWAPNRTDGGAFRGLAAGDALSITIDPGFNEAAAAWGDWDYSATPTDRITEWRVFTGPDETATLDRNESVTISRGGCDGPPSAALTAQPSTAAVSESVTLNASASTDDEGVRGYGWDFDGDGTVDLNTTAPTAAYTYEETGEYQAAVTVFDYANNTDVATTTVTVTESGSDGDSGTDDDSDTGDGDTGDGDTGDGDTGDGPDDVPMAALTGPETAMVGEPVSLDASASIDGDGIASYGWNFDGDTATDRTTTGPTVETRYDEPGTYTVVVSVKDEKGNTATAEHAIQVGDGPPTGEIDAPETATVGDPITAEAVNLADADGLSHVCWYVDGATGPVGRTLQYTFDEPGTHEITLKLRDGRGKTTLINREITVVSDDEDRSDTDDGNSDDEKSDDGNSDDGKSDDGDRSDTGDDGGDDGSEDGSDDGSGTDGEDGPGVGLVEFDPEGPIIAPLDLDDLESSGPSADDTETTNETSVSVAAVQTTRQTVDAGSQVEITVRFDATGDADAVPVTVRRLRENESDSLVEELSVGVPENETGTASVATTMEQPGEYRASVGDRTVAFSVLAPAPGGSDDAPVTDDGSDTEEPTRESRPADDPADSTGTTETTTSGAAGPGFGVLVAVLGLVLAGLLAGRRRGR